MKLSVVIVNYNVEYFLEQCLQSVYKACKDIDSEVWVVDNASVDGSVEMVKNKFPWVKLIESKENLGFSAGNNLAIHKSIGEYVLLLNPDTIVEETTFSKTIQFMDEHKDAGGLGVHMVDGQGVFLPESKRGLPTPWVSFCKIFGLSRIFPKSEKFNKYHLGHLPKNENHEIDILSGAFMMMRKEALDKVGVLDERFFMYGEDIDLSWRLIKGGFKNYYFAETSIIHYKGESTKKGSLNYVFVFYRAMVIFAKKHFSEKNASTFSFFIHMAIYLRATAAIVNRFVKKLWLPVVEGLAMFGSLILVKNYYGSYRHKIFEDELVLLGLGIYTMIWVVSMSLSGAYKYRRSAFRIIRGIVLGTGFILLLYALLPESVRFSRAIILLGSISSLITIALLRQVLVVVFPSGFEERGKNETRYLIIGDQEEFDRISRMLDETKSDSIETFPIILENEDDFSREKLLLDEKTRVFAVDEIIFCAKNISSSEIISSISGVLNKEIGIKIAPPESLYIIGSNSIDKADDIITYDVNSISTKRNVNSKRFFDLVSALLLLVLSPLLMWFTKNPLGFVKNVFLVLGARKTWVGYVSCRDISNFPKLKESVISPSNIGENVKDETANRINLVYAKDYKIKNDLVYLIRFFRSLGNDIR